MLVCALLLYAVFGAAFIAVPGVAAGASAETDNDAQSGAAGHIGTQGEHSRRAASELLVLAGDVRQLSVLAESASSPLLRKGLTDRILGALSGIDMLLRLADQEAGRPPVSYRPQVQRATGLLRTAEWNALNALLAKLTEQYPLAIPAFTPSAQLLESSRDLHQRLCAACHDVPATAVERPAYNLSEQAQRGSAAEFFARMLVGVRGDRVTGIDNPLSDVQIAGLIHFYTLEPGALRDGSQRSGKLP